MNNMPVIKLKKITPKKIIRPIKRNTGFLKIYPKTIITNTPVKANAARKAKIEMVIVKPSCLLNSDEASASANQV